MTHFNLHYTVQLYYNENNHGMGPMDGVGRIMKKYDFSTRKIKQNVWIMVLKIMLSMQTK